MLLAVDVGNTNTVLGLYEEESLVHDFRVESNDSRTSDEYRVLLHNLVSLAGISPSRVTASIMSSVVPALNERLVEAVDRAFDHDMLVVGPGVRTGMPILYDNPKEVGADRIVNAVAAFERVRGPVLVVDFGTATTFDCVSQKGEYLGGLIVPGIEISANALFTHAAKLPKVEIAKPPRLLGKNTVHSMQSGLVYGYVALVDGLARKLQAELGYECPVIATGGLARVIAPESEEIDETDDYLTLEGLRIIYGRNATSAARA